MRTGTEIPGRGESLSPNIVQPCAHCCTDGCLSRTGSGIDASDQGNSSFAKGHAKPYAHVKAEEEARTRTVGTPRFVALAITCDRAQFAGQEVIGRPGTTDRELTVFQLLGGGSVSVLIFLDRLRIDQVGDIN